MVPPLKVLQENGVVIEEDPSGITPLPPSAKALCDLLLNFNDAVPREAKFHLEDLCHADNQLMNLRMHPDQSAYCDSKHKSYQARWIAAQEVRQRARGFSSDARQKEETWQHFMTGSVLGDINEQASCDGIFMRDLVAMGSKALFTNAVEIRGMLSGNQHRPQPDVCFGLSLFDRDQISHLKGAERLDEGIVHFEEDRISNLHRDDDGILMCRPIKSMPKLAFPWTIAEFKKEFGDEPEALRQAANSCHTCIKLCEHLANRTGKESSPLVAITSVGPSIKLFVTYGDGESHPGRRIYRMSCIWTGHVQHIWSVVQLQCIVHHLMFWALRIFKPWVTECLTEVYRKEASRQDEESSSGDDSSDSGSDHTRRRGRTGRQTSSKSSSSATSDHSDTQNVSDVSESASESACESTSESTSSDPSSDRYPPANCSRPLSERGDIRMQQTNRERVFPRLYTQADIYSRPVVKNSRKIKVNLPPAHLYNSLTNSQPQLTLNPTLFGHAVANQQSRPDPRESTGTNSDLNSPGAEQITDRRTPLSVAGESGSGREDVIERTDKDINPPMSDFEKQIDDYRKNKSKFKFTF